MKKISDKVFGELEVYDLGWRKNYSICILGDKYSIELSVDGENEISKMQKKTFQELEQNKDAYVNLIENSIFDYYTNNIQTIRSYIESNEWEIKAPIINNKQEIKKLVKPSGIVIPDYIDDGVITFGVTFDCSWLEDHTFVIRFDNDEITIGTEEIIY